MRGRLTFLFFTLFALELFLPPFRNELFFDLAIIAILSTHLIQLLQRRSVSKRFQWIRFSLFCISGVYFVFLLATAWETKGDFFSPPTEAWRSLMHAWFFISATVVAMSSPTFIRFFSQLQQHPPRFISVIYIATALISTLLLVLPISLEPDVELSYLDAFFTSVSALSGAGLTINNTALSFSLFGEMVLLVVIQAGGIGIITFSGILLLLIGKELGLRERVIQDDLERLWFFGSLKKFVLYVSLLAFSVEAIGAVLLYPFMRGISQNAWEAVFHSVFQSVSSFCTAGFSTIPDGMLVAEGHPFVLVVMGCIAIVGMTGVPTIFSLLYLFNPRSTIRRLGPYAKMELLLAIGLLLFGTLSLFFVEAGNTIYSSWTDRLVDSFFQSAQRASGFSSVVIADMTTPALFILMSLMFVAGAPMSTAGGIKTSTIGIILISVVSFLRGKSEASFSRYRLAPSLLTKAVSLVFLYFVSLFIGYMVLIYSESATGLELLFEAISALSVVGFSLGITESLTSTGKSVIIVLMMLGRIGLLTALYALLKDRRPDRFRYPLGDFYVG